MSEYYSSFLELLEHYQDIILLEYDNREVLIENLLTETSKTVPRWSAT